MKLIISGENKADSPPSNEGDSPPPNEGDSLPSNEGDSPPPNEGDSPPPNEGDSPSSDEDELAVLKLYDTIIAVDNSGSMGGSRWEETRDAISEIANLASKYDNDGIDVYLFNQPVTSRTTKKETEKKRFRKVRPEGMNFKTGKQVEEFFNSIEPRGGTPLGACLEKVVRDVFKKEKGGVWNRWNPKGKKYNILVITDGEPDKGDNTKEVIIWTAGELQKMGATTDKLGIQFVQIGDDEKAMKFLMNLDDNLKEECGLDIVDTEQYYTTDGGLTGDAIKKILLGGFNRKFDKLEQSKKAPAA